MKEVARLSVRGRVIDAATGRTLGGLHVRAYDRRLVWDDCLGCSDTDADGRFRIPLASGAHLESQPEVYIVVYGPGLHQLHFTQPVHVSADASADMQIALHTAAVPAAARERTHAA